MPWATDTLRAVLPQIDGLTYSPYSSQMRCSRYLRVTFTKPTEGRAALYLNIRAGKRLQDARDEIADIEIPLGPGSRLAAGQRIDKPAWKALVEGPVSATIFAFHQQVERKLLEALFFDDQIQTYCSDQPSSSDGTRKASDLCAVLPLKWSERSGLANSLFMIDAAPKQGFADLHLIGEAAGRCAKYWDSPVPYDAVPILFRRRILGDEIISIHTVEELDLPWSSSDFRVYEYRRRYKDLRPCGPVPDVIPSRVAPQ